MTTTDLTKLPQLELARAVREGLLSEEKAGAILFHRAKRKLWKLEREQAESAEAESAGSAESSDDPAA